ncbi:STAS domain-containing protein [Embleya sp. NPDC056575]|uniref:STAS domain-containing protein n=1 Tax=unclassified Embleya TaxID=2699296 RepID=UPI0036916FC0
MVEPPEPPQSAEPATSQPVAALIVYAPLTRADVPGLCARLVELLHRERADPFPCDVSALVRPDLAVIEALARLQLTARGLGRCIRLRGASGELRDLLTLTGLDEIVPAGPRAAGLRVECRREAEQREQVWHVQERVEADDPSL